MPFCFNELIFSMSEYNLSILTPPDCAPSHNTYKQTEGHQGTSEILISTAEPCKLTSQCSTIHHIPEITHQAYEDLKDWI